MAYPDSRFLDLAGTTETLSKPTCKTNPQHLFIDNLLHFRQSLYATCVILCHLAGCGSIVFMPLKICTSQFLQTIDLTATLSRLIIYCCYHDYISLHDNFMFSCPFILTVHVWLDLYCTIHLGCASPLHLIQILILIQFLFKFSLSAGERVISPVWPRKQSAELGAHTQTNAPLCVLCCVSLSTAGSAVGPFGSAGRTVRRCLSAASNSLPSHRTGDRNDRSTHRMRHGHAQMTGGIETKTGSSRLENLRGH